MANHTVIGLDQLSKELKQLGKKEIKAAARSMTSGAARMVKKSAKANVKRMGLVKSGALHRNIIIMRDKYPIGNSTGHIVKVRHGKRLDKLKSTEYRSVARKGGGIKIQRLNDPYYWRFLEFGWKHKGNVKNRRGEVSRGYRGVVKGRSFIGSAYSANEYRIPDEMAQSFDKSMRKKRSAHGRNMVKWGYR